VTHIRAKARRVAIFGVVPSLTWSVARCLVRAGWSPVVFGWHRVSPLSLVRGCTYVPLQGVRWTKGELDPTVVLALDAACREHGIQKLMAVDFPAIALLSEHGAALHHAELCPLPSAATVHSLHNKWLFSRLCTRLDLPQPKTEMAATAEELFATRLSFPIITKPVDRWASVGFMRHDTPAALRIAVENRVLGAEFPLLVQEFSPGSDAGFAFVAQNGKIVSHTAFEQPRKGARRYFHSPELLAYATKIVAHTQYSGVGEIDARYDPACKTYKLLEVNPRFWASMLYAAHAGMNFPDLVLNLGEHTAETGCTATAEPVSLSWYELAIAKAVQISERVHSRINRWLGI
jgi:predicted ATP-grasp superfamily ATP-dependent carboligase